MKPLTLKAHAKLNLTLDILGKRDDGYHDIESVEQQISLHDVISVEPSDDMIIKCDSKDIPKDSSNLCWKAAELIKNQFNINDNVKITIKKNIPVGAGLGGGSSDAAATLKALNTLWELGLSQDVLVNAAAKTGMDVPFSILGGTCLATQRGDIVKKIKPLPELSCIIVFPGFSVPTKDAYASLDYDKTGKKNATRNLINQINNNDKNQIINSLHNDFEYTVLQQYPEIKNIKELLKDAGANNPAMTGSGSAVFCLEDDKNKANSIYKQIHKTYKNSFLCSTWSSR